MPVVFIVLFIVFFLFVVGKIIAQFFKNENSPVVATRARLIDKRCDVHTHTDSNGMMHSDETLYLIFELDTASTMKFSVSVRIYRSVAMHEWGRLTFQGTRFLKFESASAIVEK